MFYAGATNVPLSIKLEEANDLLFRLVHADVKYILVSYNAENISVFSEKHVNVFGETCT